MKRFIRLPVMIAAIAFTSMASAEGPSSYFNQETAEVVSSGTINVDLYNPGSTQLRIGAFSGEVITDLNSDTLQYKKSLSKNFAVYGGLGITTNAAKQSTNTLIVGAAYTSKSDSLIFNINPVLINTAGNSAVDVNLGAFLPLDKSSSYPGRILPGMSVYLPISPNGGTSVIVLGARWEVNPRFTVEAGLYNTGSGLQFPGLFRINLTI